MPIAPKPMSLFNPRTIDPAQLNAFGKPKLPPGQLVTEKFPVMTYGATPIVDTKDWTFGVFGCVIAERSWTWDEFMSLPQSTLRADFHCVTHWSRFDDEYQGIRFIDFFDAVRDVVDPAATHVLQHAHGGYTTNLPLQLMLEEDVIFVHSLNGERLSPEHGGPMRVFTPRRYAWKGAKWIRRIEFMTTDRPGFWEQNGYSNTADPWSNDRYW